MKQPGRACLRISELRDRILTEGVEMSRQKWIELGMPADQFNSELARKQLDEHNSIMLVAVIDYLDELANQEK